LLTFSFDDCSAGGLKAAINNPNVPEESKKDAEARLNKMNS
jgi:hypothetical protein